MTTTNTRVLFKEAPEGWVETKHMEVSKVDFNPDTVQLDVGDVVLKVLYLSLDPYMRGRMRVGGKSYSEPFKLGEVLHAGGVAEVYRVGGSAAKFQKGDIVQGMVGWEQWTVARKGQLDGFQKVEVVEGVPLSYYLGVLGMPGMTAYMGLLKICQPKAGETVYVSGAAGAVGLVVGQIAKILGCRVVGSAGTDEKVDLLKEYGFDAAFNYKTETDFIKALEKYCPDGIDCYFDNVGGEMLDAVLKVANRHARFAGCGQISQYNAVEPYGVKNLMQMVAQRILFEGFIVGDYMSSRADFVRDVTKWVKEGKIKYTEHVVEGIEKAPEMFVKLFEGVNIGKLIIKVA
ncbi:hypothetical protein HK097_009101 [Rhizophlyctis rosea]|uniref:Enoyl reductase (ER) domain-containing protein n=1 Tax=Rhizophlyctis rosea TaxID=64517 RepID=A0AAD5SHI9_9FUNG|nr:hypothetical protein HK097_009101 [Rhizophlyctis rosea]